MNIQEREEMEFGDGYPNELARIHAQVKGETRLNIVNRKYVNWLTTLGFYAVISFDMRYCVWTDAPIGFDETLMLVTRSSEAVDELKDDMDIFVFYPEKV